MARVTAAGDQNARMFDCYQFVINRALGVEKGGDLHPCHQKTKRYQFVTNALTSINTKNGSIARLGRCTQGWRSPPFSTPSAHPPPLKGAPKMNAQPALFDSPTRTPGRLSELLKATDTPQALQAWLGPGKRGLRASACRDCGQVIAEGWDDDSAAFYAHLDPVPLTWMGEALTLAQGRRTYTVTRAGNAIQAIRRGRWRSLRPSKTDVWPAHRCQAPPMPPVAFATTNLDPLATAALPPDAPPPF